MVGELVAVLALAPAKLLLLVLPEHVRSANFSQAVRNFKVLQTLPTLELFHRHPCRESGSGQDPCHANERTTSTRPICFFGALHLGAQNNDETNVSKFNQSVLIGKNGC